MIETGPGVQLLEPSGHSVAGTANPRDDGDRMAKSGPVLSIVIPALDEEEAIGATIERCLAARETIVAESPVSEVEVIPTAVGSADVTALAADRVVRELLTGLALRRRA